MKMHEIKHLKTACHQSKYDEFCKFWIPFQTYLFSMNCVLVTYQIHQIDIFNTLCTYSGYVILWFACLSFEKCALALDRLGRKRKVGDFNAFYQRKTKWSTADKSADTNLTVITQIMQQCFFCSLKIRICSFFRQNRTVKTDIIADNYPK